LPPFGEAGATLGPRNGGIAIPMDAFEVNKTVGAVLSALLVIFAGKTTLDIVYKEHKPEKPGWALPITEPAAASKGPAAPFDATKVVGLLPKANPENGQEGFRKCLTCHTPQKGGPNGTGPNLWGVVGRKPGSQPGFAYSEAMKNKGGEWTWDALATYLHDPRGSVPGNKMAFPGIKDETDLADVLAYLRKLSDSPPALPQ
jgi:cytochrome c